MPRATPNGRPALSNRQRKAAHRLRDTTPNWPPRMRLIPAKRGPNGPRETHLSGRHLMEYLHQFPTAGNTGWHVCVGADCGTCRDRSSAIVRR